MVMSIDTPLSSFSKDSVISFSSPTSKLWVSQDWRHWGSSRNDSYYTKNTTPQPCTNFNQPISPPYIHTRESYIMKSTPKFYNEIYTISTNSAEYGIIVYKVRPSLVCTKKYIGLGQDFIRPAYRMSVRLRIIFASFVANYSLFHIDQPMMIKPLSNVRRSVLNQTVLHWKSM
jgi:hypothetical protein